MKSAILLRRIARLRGIAGQNRGDRDQHDEQDPSERALKRSQLRSSPMKPPLIETSFE